MPLRPLSNGISTVLLCRKQYQKKQEMLAIATSLGLKVDPSTHTRESLEELITKELRARRSELESDPLYEKLYESYDRDARREK